ncbi:expressed unknown protein [Seminavis robusta]|uniref:EGF-like domain-containing protein n=1 Tax=Seminavis robusta TaxID=568900 RepID=A0A9N8E6Y6_9STRA|nr:expressed unknown protein [Seminavis robusta]|eukprot:Sro730_g194040.1 n/a (245) ;mRNA; f:28445-29179
MKLSLLSIAAFMSFGRSVVANGSVAGCAIDQTLLVGIGFGYDAHDNFWELRDICTNTVIDSTTAGTYTSNQRVDLNWCLDNTSRFRFTIFDNGENGILVRRGEGPTFPGLTLNWANNVLTEVGGSFWQYNNFPMRSDLYSQQYEFGATSCPTAPPAITETPPTGPEPNPCEPSPCEENTFCHPQPDGTAYCVCKEHFIGDPLQGCTGGPPTPTPPTPTPSNPGAGGDPHCEFRSSRALLCFALL